MVPEDFDTSFSKLLGFRPFEWQRSLFHDWFSKGAIPSAVDIPTGLGKTSVMAIWYLALRTGARIPRRLVYVVDRRAVIDQATTVADQIRENSKDSELRVSTLRGQHVDNREWLADPGAPAIVAGTVDMIGSRLLFSGYGVSRKMRPYHAGLLGTDTLVALDEAHLVPAFEKLLEVVTNGVDAFGPREQENRDIVPSFKLLSLSATRRDSRANDKQVFQLSAKHREDACVERRLEARKRLTIRVLEDAAKLVPELAEQAWRFGNHHGSARVLVYCDRREDAVKVKGTIDKKFGNVKRKPVELLVGGRRVFEREALSDWLKKHGFLGDARTKPEQPTFLVATSAGEVGVDLDADHMVCDLVAWERMVQRLGRVNRRGEGDARIEVLAAPRPKEKSEDWTTRRDRLRKPLDTLPVGQDGERDASPGALLGLKERAETDLTLQKAIEEATTPPPLRPALTRALADAWSLTSLEKHTGRPDDIQPWLRGWEEDPKPQTTIIWRKHLPVREDGVEIAKKDIEAFFEAAPADTSEKLEIETDTVIAWLEKRAARFTREQADHGARGDLSRQEGAAAYALSPARDWRHTILWREIVDLPNKSGTEARTTKDILRRKLAGATLVFDARFGGLSNNGMLEENTGGSPRVADDGGEWLPPPRPGSPPTIRFRVRSVTWEDSPEPVGDWWERHRFTTEQSDEGEIRRFLLVEKWRHDAETEDDRSVGRLQELAEHHAWTEGKARALADAINLPGKYTEMLTIAARLHDEGKRNPRWQRAVNVPSDGKWYAKSDKRMNTKLLDGYRHEFGSLPYAEEDEGFRSLPDHLQELALHLVAAHHGWARPIISTSGCNEPPSTSEKRACDIALRFARLQRRWGPWGLAWWEALLRAADQQASRDNDERGKGLINKPTTRESV